MSRHGLPDHLLSEFTSGVLDSEFEVLVESHLALSAASHDDLKLHQEIGGLLLSQLPVSSEHLAAIPAPETVELQMEPAPDVDQTAALSNGPDDLPEPLISFLRDVAGATQLSELEWYSYYIGIDRAILTEGPEGVRARILRCEPGAKFPVHGHGSEEVSLVLQGAYEDETGRYVRGDVQCVPAEKTHGPVVDKDELCYVLVVSELPAIWLGESNGS